MSETNLELRGKLISEDQQGNICLNDLWALAGSPANRRATEWRRGARAKSLVAALVNRIMGDSHKGEKEVEESVYYTSGRAAQKRTFAHPVLALDYAEYLSPDLGIEVNTVFLRFRARDMSLALEIMDGMNEQTEFDQTRVELRRLLAEHNKLSAAAAKDAGVTNYPAYNGAGLKGLYGGLTKADVVRKKGLPVDASHLDHAGHEELAANYFKATQAEAKLKREKIHGQVPAMAAHEKVGKIVRATIAELGGTMPEDEPSIEHVDEARKRIKAAAPKALPKPSGDG